MHYAKKGGHLMLEKVCEEIVGALRAEGIEAREKYSGGDAGEVNAPTVFVGISAVKAEAAGLGHYLGTKEREDMTQVELYGLRCAVEVAIDIYAPAQMHRCAAECAALFDRAIAAFDSLGGISIEQVSLDDGSVQAKSGLYRCPCCIRGSAYIVAECGDGAAFTDFVLKGVLKK